MTEYDYVHTRRDQVRTFSPQQARRLKPFMRFFSRLHVCVYKLSRGRLMGKLGGKYPVCIIGMTGARSGRRRELPLLYLPHGEGILLVASQGGMPRHPAWYANLMAHPVIDVTHRGVTRRMTVRQVSEEEKRELWPTLLSYYPAFDQYQARTDRSIPVLECLPVA